MEVGNPVTAFENRPKHKKCLSMLRLAYRIRQSYFVPAVIIVAGVYIFICFVPQYAALLSFAWVIVVSYVYIKYNRWY